MNDCCEQSPFKFIQLPFEYVIYLSRLGFSIGHLQSQIKPQFNSGRSSFRFEALSCKSTSLKCEKCPPLPSSIERKHQNTRKVSYSGLLPFVLILSVIKLEQINYVIVPIKIGTVIAISFIIHSLNKHLMDLEHAIEPCEMSQQNKTLVDRTMMRMIMIFMSLAMVLVARTDFHFIVDLM